LAATQLESFLLRRPPLARQPRRNGTIHRIAIRLATLGVVLAAWAPRRTNLTWPLWKKALRAGMAHPLTDYARQWRDLRFRATDGGPSHAAVRHQVRVRRLDSANSIVVRINDRGPFVESRIIDLSYAAAQRLGLTDPASSGWPWRLWSSRDYAEPQFLFTSGWARSATRQRPPTAALMKEKFGDTVTVQHSGEFWRVLVGTRHAGGRRRPRYRSPPERSGVPVRLRSSLGQ